MCARTDAASNFTALKVKKENERTKGFLKTFNSGFISKKKSRLNTTERKIYDLLIYPKRSYG
jgi:hypothetical protein